MTFDDIPLSKAPDERGYNSLLADFVGVDVRQVEGWKRRGKIPDGYQRLIKYKLSVLHLAAGFVKL